MAVVFNPGFTIASTGKFTAAGKFLTGEPDCVRVGGDEYGMEFPTSAGVSGAGSKNFGFRGKLLQVRFYIVDTSEDNVYGAWDSINSAIAGVPVSVDYGGAAYTRCFLDAKGSFLGNVKDSGLGTYFAEAMITMIRRG